MVRAKQGSSGKAHAEGPISGGPAKTPFELRVEIVAGYVADGNWDHKIIEQLVRECPETTHGQWHAAAQEVHKVSLEIPSTEDARDFIVRESVAVLRSSSRDSDRLKALELIAKARGVLEKNLNVNAVNKMSDKELDKAIDDAILELRPEAHH